MGWLKKAWKGVKKAVKKVARGAKKLAKKVAYAVPGGKQLWDFSSKVGKKAVKGIGKVVNKLGPVGMIALSVLMPYAAPLWAAFGAAAGAMGGVLGSIGTAVYTAGNWVAGTLGAMTSGISNAIGGIAEGGLSGIAEGSLSKAASTAVDGFASAFTGEAGKAGIQAGVQASIDYGIKEAAGQTLLDQTTSKIMGDVGGFDKFGDTALEGSTNQVNDTINQNLIDLNPANSPETLMEATKAGVNQATDFSNFGTEAANTFAPQTLETQATTMLGNETAASAASYTNKSLLEKSTDVAKDLLSNNSGGLMGQSQQIAAVGDVGGRTFKGNAQSGGGVGSGGGSFLSQAMLQAMQQQTQRMTRGFG